METVHKSSVSEYISNLIWFQSTVGAVDLGYVSAAVTKAGWISPSEHHATVVGELSEASLFKISLDIWALQSSHLCGCSVDMPLGLWMLCEGGAEQKRESLANYKSALSYISLYCSVYMFLKQCLGHCIVVICCYTSWLDSEMSGSWNSWSRLNFYCSI